MQTRTTANRPAKKRNISISAPAFGVSDYHIESVSTSQRFFAPAYLPDRAKITKIGFIGWKQPCSNGDTVLTLRYVDSWVTPNNHVIRDIGVVTTAAPPTAMQDYYSVNVNNHRVDNARRTYFLLLELPADPPGYPGANNFYMANIEYIVPR